MAVPLRLGLPLLLPLAHPVPPPANVALALAEASPVPVRETLGDAEPPALGDVTGVSEASLEGEDAPLRVAAPVAVCAALLLRRTLPLPEGQADDEGEREELGDPDPQRDALREADAHPDPVALRVELLDSLAHEDCEAQPLGENVPGPLLAVALREALPQLEEEGERLPGGAVADEALLPVAALLSQAVVLQLRVAVPQREALPLTEAQAVEVRDTAGEAEADALSAGVGERRPLREMVAHAVSLEDCVAPPEGVALPAVAEGEGAALPEPARPPVGVDVPLVLGGDVAVPPAPPSPLTVAVALGQGEKLGAIDPVPPLLSEGVPRAVRLCVAHIETTADKDALPEELPPPVPLFDAELQEEGEAQTLCVRLPEGLVVAEREMLPQPDAE